MAWSLWEDGAVGRPCAYAVILVFAALTVMSAGAGAATLNVVGGQLVGASGVDVSGTLYDVEFVDGTCIDLFDGCDEPSDFTFSTQGSATAAAKALMDQVFIDGIDGLFDSNPGSTFGCTGSIECDVWTPYKSNMSGLSVGVALNWVLNDGYHVQTGKIPSFDTSFSSVVFARFTQVPEPSTSLLFTLGLIGMSSFNKRRRVSR